MVLFPINIQTCKIRKEEKEHRSFAQVFRWTELYATFTTFRFNAYAIYEGRKMPLTTHKLECSQLSAFVIKAYFGIGNKFFFAPSFLNCSTCTITQCTFQ